MNYYMSKIDELGAYFGTLSAFFDYVENLYTIAASISMAVVYWFLLVDP